MSFRHCFQHSLLIGALALGPLAGCGDDEEQDTTAEGGEGTSGGENGDGQTGELERPPGSRDADSQDPGWDGDTGGGNTGGETAGTGTGTGTGTGEEPSPWGATQAEQCRPPNRRAMSSSAQRAFDAGVRAASSGNTAEATSSFQRALSEDSNAFKAAYNLGVLADRAGNANRAMEFYRQALRIQSDYEAAAEGIVTIHLRRGSVPDALSFVEPLARVHRTNLHLQALYAEVLVRAERFDAAWTAARAALHCDERFVPALTAVIKASLRQGRMELARSVLDQALSIDDNNAELHFIKGTLLRDEPGRLREAMTELQRAVTLRPDYVDARMALGIQLLSGGNYTDALQHFQSAAQLAPALVAVHLNLGDGYRATKQWTKAKASFEKALSMESQLPQAHFNMGLMYLSAGENFPGLDDLTSLQAAKQEFTRYRNEMGSRLRRDDPSQGYLEDIDRQVERIERRRERDARNAARDAERAARAAQQGGGDE
mgnify:CR=1 FL=1